MSQIFAPVETVRSDGDSMTALKTSSTNPTMPIARRRFLPFAI
ncbi:MAG: hypothetical protein ABI810_20315 [Sphingomonas bacterium]